MKISMILALGAIVAFAWPNLARADGEAGSTSIACDSQCDSGQKLVSVVNGEASASCYCAADNGGTMDEVPIPATPENPTDGLSRDPND